MAVAHPGGNMCAKAAIPPDSVSVESVPDYRQVFHHLLHDMASGVSGLGTILEMMALDDAPRSDDRAEMLVAARGAAERLRTVIIGARELAKPLERSTSVAAPIDVRALLTLIEGHGSRRIGGISADSDALQASVAADATLFAALIRAFVGNCGDDAAVRVTADMTHVRFAIETRSRRTLTSHVIDYLADCVASQHGTTLQRAATPEGQVLAISLTRWTWSGASAA